MKSRGRPPKKQKTNMTGLRNQSQRASPNLSGVSAGRSGSSERGLDARLIVRTDNISITFDSIRVNWEEEEGAQTEVSDVDDEMELDIWDDEDLADMLEEMTKKADSKDAEWLPPRLKKEQSRRSGRCSYRRSTILLNYGTSSTFEGVHQGP